MATTQKTGSLQTDFDTEVVDESQPTIEPTAVAKDENGIPYCRKHHVRMKQTSGGKKGSQVAYHSCPVADCQETSKRIKTMNESSVPSKPQHCPRCSTDKKPIVLERSPRHSTGYYTILQCPACQFKSTPMPRPEFIAAQKRARNPAVEDIGSR